MALTPFLDYIQKNGLSGLAGIATGAKTVSGDTHTQKAGTFTGVRTSDGRQAVINEKGQTEYLTASQALQRGYINELDYDTLGVRRFDTFREVTNKNLLSLGQSSVDISGALLNENKVREEQRAEDNRALMELTAWVDSINQRLSGQVSEIGKTAGGGAFNLFGLGIGALIVGGVVVYVVYKVATR